jgi:SAM-dependent methyltransferase
VTAPPCPVCRAAATRFLLTADARDYFACPVCEARFLRPDQRPTPAEERAEYDRHDNRVDDPGYRAFLERLAGPIRAATPGGAEGLDFGCGPGPALAAMLTESGRPTATWDPFYAPDPAPLRRRWDFVTASEVFEHLHDPAGTLDLLAGLLRPGGVLGVMTCFQTDDARFAGWWYRKDPTHVVFWREATLRHVAAARGWRLSVPRKDVALMRAP